MKLKIAKIVFLVICVAAFIFLLLPFLETTPQPTPAQLKTQPQVTTSNPLTALAKRLANLWHRPERTTHTLAARPFASPAQDRSANAPLIIVRNAPQDDFTQDNPRQQEGTGLSLPPSPDTDYGEAAFLTDDGQWVLVRQEAPQGGKPGMHEVNVHDNPYDRYVKHERARRTIPQEPKAEIPDSKWARLIRPVKKFLGLDTPTKPASVQRENDRAHGLVAARTGQADIKNPSFGPARMPLPDITPQEWETMTPFERERHQIAQFAELVSGTREVEEAASILADAKYPHPKDQKEKNEKQAFQTALSEEGKQRVKERLLQIMQANAQGKEPVDELAYAMSCTNASLPSKSEACDIPEDGHQPIPPATEQSVLEQEQNTNAQTFYQTTQYILPKGLPLTPVLGPTTPQTISSMSGPTQDTQKTAEIYQFLYEQQGCASQTCYWVANSKQIDPQLKDAVSMANAVLKPDPKSTYATYKDAFVRYKVDQLGDSASQEQLEQARQEAGKQFDENAVHYVPYTAQQVRDVQTQTLQAANPANTQGQATDITVFYVTDPTQAQQFATDIDSVIFAYGKTPLTETSSAVEAGRLITESAAQNVNDAKQVIQDVNLPQYQQSVRENIRQQLNEQSREQNRNGAGWKGIFERTKQMGNQNGQK